MAGYFGYSKSWNAIEAEKHYRFPKSKLSRFGITKSIIDKIGYEPDEYHHTSKFYNTTYYYDVVEILFEVFFNRKLFSAREIRKINRILKQRQFSDLRKKVLDRIYSEKRFYLKLKFSELFDWNCSVKNFIQNNHERLNISYPYKVDNIDEKQREIMAMDIFHKLYPSIIKPAIEKALAKSFNPLLRKDIKKKVMRKHYNIIRQSIDRIFTKYPNPKLLLEYKK